MKWLQKIADDAQIQFLGQRYYQTPASSSKLQNSLRRCKAFSNA